MKKGDIVTIYYDPSTKQEVEGQAQLLEHVESWDGWILECWKVKFLGGESRDPIVNRFLKKELKP